MISPTIFFNLVLGVIGALQVFDVALRRDQGRPGLRDLVLSRCTSTSKAFEYFDMGYASALAWLFFIVLFVFTYVQFRLRAAGSTTPASGAADGSRSRSRARSRTARARRRGRVTAQHGGLYLLLSVLGSCRCSRSSGPSSARSRRSPSSTSSRPRSGRPSRSFVENYAEILTRVPFARWLWNTLLRDGPGADRHGALGLAGRLLVRAVPLPGRDLFFLVTLGTLMLPDEVTLIPQYLLFKQARLARHLPAADRAVLVRRRRLQHLPAAPVLHDDPARPRRGGPDRRRELPGAIFWRS